MGRRRKDQMASLDMVEAIDAEAMDAAEVLPSAVEAQEDVSAAAHESKIIAEYHEELPSKPASKWLVLEDQTVSLFGQMTLLPAGTVVSVASYGPAGIKRIMEQGVELEPLG